MFLWQVLEGPDYRVDADTEYPLTVRFTHNASDPSDLQQLYLILSNNATVVVKPKTEFDWQLDFVSYIMPWSKTVYLHS